MLLHRVLTALVGVPIVLAAIWFGPPWLTLVAGTVGVIGVWEAYRLYPPISSADPDSPPTPLPVLLGGAWAVALVLAGELAVKPGDFGVAAITICVVGCIIGGLWMIAAWRGRRPVVAAIYLVTPPAYIGGALACAVALRGVIGKSIVLPWGESASVSEFSPPPAIEENGFAEPLEIPPAAATENAGVWLLPDIAGTEFAQSVANLTDLGCWLLLLAILTVYAADTGAYAVGRLIGRHRMAPGISPGKTWEGTAGGMAAAVVAAVVLGILFPLQIQIWQAALIGVILGAVSPAGDLLESKVKRLADAKDSGNLFPGHGGMLDRLDSLLPSVAIVYILAVTITVAT
ncbi:MAG: CDP-archaeol synthase [Dehalococcoidia bacterium]|nr:CDP-archaeol synthase [Dehalococcoidia bacterium]